MPSVTGLDHRMYVMIKWYNASTRVVLHSSQTMNHPFHDFHCLAQLPKAPPRYILGILQELNLGCSNDNRMALEDILLYGVDI